MLFGVGGEWEDLTFGLSMRYLGVALDIVSPWELCRSGNHHRARFSQHLLPGYERLLIAHLQRNSRRGSYSLGIAIIGVAGSMKAASLSEEEKKAAVKRLQLP